MQSRPVQENKPAVSQAAPPPQAGPNLAQRRLTQDGFTPDTRSRQAQSLFGGTPTPYQPLPTGTPAGGTSAPGGGGPVLTPNPTVPVVTTAPPGQAATTVSPQVQAALDDINAYQPASQPIGLASALKEHGSNSPEDVAFRRELMTALGPDRVAELMGHVSAMPSDGPDIARTVLTAATEAFPVADQGKLVKALGPEMLGAALATGVEAAGSPDTVGRDAALAQMQGLAKMVGDLSALPAGAPGQAEVAGALDRLKNNEQFCKGPGVTTAAWLVANSGNDALKSSFANGYLEAYKADATSLSPEEARAVAWTLGSMTPSATNGLDTLLALPQAERSGFLTALGTAPEGAGAAPELKNTGVFFQQDVQAGVNGFLEDVANLDPSRFPTGQQQAARELRIETFQKVSLAVDSPFFGDSAETHLALAHMFEKDTAGIINASADSKEPLMDIEGKALAKFFDHVAFRGEAGRDIVMEAVKQYLGTGDRVGIVDTLVEGKGDVEFMKARGNLLARDLGFVLGALGVGSQSAMASLDSEEARKKAIVTVLGSLVETAIEANPAVSGMYSKIKDGSAGEVSVDKVFNWLGEHFGVTTEGATDASKEGIQTLANVLIHASWRPFFGNDALQGASPADLTPLYELVNGGVALADGYVDPNLNTGGAPRN
ncbi:hypothetical protein D7X12_15110 [Corallococcus sicarius]|uniref:Uncharacterized protein n=1 Tax=Corallococcus sicarius TaxID=2316726 RepID=A0A3A8NN90_9BACT|nr:hypothetical protein D7X12_15110 [Corallococcus sicarius]